MISGSHSALVELRMILSHASGCSRVRVLRCFCLTAQLVCSIFRPCHSRTCRVSSQTGAMHGACGCLVEPLAVMGDTCEGVFGVFWGAGVLGAAEVEAFLRGVLVG